eukprot:6469112-Amphidinium_carterae.1
MPRCRIGSHFLGAPAHVAGVRMPLILIPCPVSESDPRPEDSCSSIGTLEPSRATSVAAPSPPGR